MKLVFVTTVQKTIRVFAFWREGGNFSSPAREIAWHTKNSFLWKWTIIFIASPLQSFLRELNFTRFKFLASFEDNFNKPGRLEALLCLLPKEDWGIRKGKTESSSTRYVCKKENVKRFPDQHSLQGHETQRLIKTLPKVMPNCGLSRTSGIVRGIAT